LRNDGLVCAAIDCQNVASRFLSACAKGQTMENDLERYAIAIIVVFGALAIGGLMAAGIAAGDRSTFLYALGASAAAWVAGYAMVFGLPRLLAVLILVALVMAIASTVAFII